jgi:hypothetical protein
VNAQQLVHSWLNGRASLDKDGRLQLAASSPPRLAEKFRQAYDWIDKNALNSP